MLEVALTIPYWLELAATIAGALFGAMSAVRARYDIFGVACIAIVTGLAGGILRDVLLQDYGIYAFQKPTLIVACVIAGVVVFYFGRLIEYLDPVMDLLDNLSVALWAVIGTGKALSAGLDVVPAVILGTLTANGGGIVRDICMNREPEAFQSGTLYMSAALLGSIVFAVMRTYHVLDQYAALACVVLVLGVRYASVVFNWRTRPARDYSDVVTQVVAKPVKSVVKHVRPQKDEAERGRERAQGGLYGAVRRVWRKPGETSPLPRAGASGSGPQGEDTAAGEEAAQAERDPLDPRS